MFRYTSDTVILIPLKAKKIWWNNQQKGLNNNRQISKQISSSLKSLSFDSSDKLAIKMENSQIWNGDPNTKIDEELALKPLKDLIEKFESAKDQEESWSSQNLTSVGPTRKFDKSYRRVYIDQSPHWKRIDVKQK